MASYSFLLFIIFIASTPIFLKTNAKLSPKHYSKTCPNALSIVKAGVIAAIKKETRIGASLLRLHFHDCFVNGCDGSILLDDTANFIGEKTAAANNNSVRGFEVVDAIKAKLEKACPKLGGPSWKVGLGRRDSTTASRSAANNSIPGPTFSLSALISSFSAEGLSLKNLVALSGSHTIGLARCTTFRSRIYNDTATIDASFAKSLQRKCPKSGNNNKLADLDLRTPFHFDNFYYKNLVKNKGLLHSDQALYNRSSADSLVRKYATDTDAFFKDFAKGMIKMGNIKPLTGSKGQIRINCRKVNS
ncbi:peroxidase 4 isoform X2 [Ziziphus jujuba]|uniref:Peroxidase n=1 Tax=Ziziphus jujuba TaxID=326968 RepID=A0A6P6FZ47_ZIZJJ|nr:peroxidase 4 isoform X2 [Ziziphus jujuba]